MKRVLQIADLQARIDYLDGAIPDTVPLERLFLIQERIHLRARLAEIKARKRR